MLYLVSKAELGKEINAVLDHNYKIQQVLRLSPFQDPDMSGNYVADYLIVANGYGDESIDRNRALVLDGIGYG